jgi:hypothetical protein
VSKGHWTIIYLAWYLLGTGDITSIVLYNGGDTSYHRRMLNLHRWFSQVLNADIKIWLPVFRVVPFRASFNLQFTRQQSRLFRKTNRIVSRSAISRITCLTQDPNVIYYVWSENSIPGRALRFNLKNNYLIFTTQKHYETPKMKTHRTRSLSNMSRTLASRTRPYLSSNLFISESLPVDCARAY